MEFTVKEALEIWPLTLGQLIAGHNGVDRVIKSVSVLEVPKETKWFKGGELQISAFYTIANDVESQIEVLHNLNRSNCSGLILCHIGHWLKSVPKELINLANKLNFPIIVVPEHLAYIDIITSIMDAILDKKDARDKYGLEIFRKMATMLLDNKNIDHIIYSLSKTINKSVLFFDTKNKCLTTGHSQISNKLITEIQESILANIDNFIDNNEYVKVNSQLTGITIFLVPVIISAKYYGTIAVLNGADLSDLDIITITESKYACGLAVIENIRLNDFKSSVMTDYYTDLIKWNFGDEIQATERASEINVNILKVSSVFTIEIFKSYTNDKELNNVDLHSKIEEIYDMVIEKAKEDNSINYVMNLENRIIIFINDCGNDSRTQSYAQELGNSFIDSIKTYINVPISVGIGNCYNSISQIRDSYLESLSAIKIGNAILNKPYCTSFQAVEILSLLFENMDTKKVSLAIENLFEPLKKYDSENNSSLVLTLKTMINCNFKTSVVSEKLFMHRNTVLQRKNKIMEILQFNPEQFPYRLILELATILEKW